MNPEIRAPILDHLSDSEITELAELIKNSEAAARGRRIDRFFPDTGTDGRLYGFDEDLDPREPLKETWSRDLYPRQLEMFSATALYSEVMFMAGNQLGKSESAGCFITWALTGEYPQWYTGRRWQGPVRVWACGVDLTAVKDVLQDRMLGPVGDFGSGLIPRNNIDFATLKDATKATTSIGQVRVRHVSGEYSTLTFKSYAQGDASYRGPGIDIIWLDEECPREIYTECLARTTATNGLLLITFTPTNGITEFIETFMGSREFTTGPVPAPQGQKPSKYVVMAGWDDVPHLTEKKKQSLLQSYPAHERAARSRGIPALGSGAVYPVDAEQVFCTPFNIPSTWRRYAAMDFGWEDPTALVWCAQDPNTGVIYQYDEYSQSHQPPSTHATAILARDRAAGFTIPKVADPSGGAKNASDGRLSRQIYLEDHGIELTPANNSLIGITRVRELLLTGGYRIFRTCTLTAAEISRYRYERGRLTGSDHLMDCIRYGVVSGLPLARNYADLHPAVNFGVYGGSVFAG